MATIHTSGPSSYSLAILGGLQRLPHIYEGTVPAATVQARRATNRRARASRRINRRK